MFSSFWQQSRGPYSKILREDWNRKQVGDIDKKVRQEIRLLIVLSLLIHANIDKVPTNIVLCSQMSLMIRTELCCPFERFHQLQMR